MLKNRELLTPDDVATILGFLAPVVAATTHRMRPPSEPVIGKGRKRTPARRGAITPDTAAD
jgi:hypothetical protein